MLGSITPLENTVYAAVLLMLVPALCAAPLHSEERAIGVVVAPRTDAPATMGADHTFIADVILRLPLTPPPGVQQPAANSGWSVTLSRTDLTDYHGRPRLLHYTFPIMRLRPLQHDVYRITVETAPWLPDGSYDLVIEGPGFHGSVAAAVTIGSRRFIQGSRLDFTSPGEIKINRAAPPEPPELWGVIVPEKTAGIAITEDGSPLLPSEAVPTTVDDQGERLLIFPLTADRQSKRTLKLKAVPEASCNIEIEWDDADRNEVLDWRDLRINSSADTVSVVWRFGDGRYGTGRHVRHRFLLPNAATVTATSYDAAGRVCSAEETLSLNALSRTGGCGSHLIGR